MHSSKCVDSVLVGALVALLAACSEGEPAGGKDDDRTPSERDAAADAAEPDDARERPLVIVTERDSPDNSLQYLHVVEDWPSSGELDNSNSIELEEYSRVHAHHGSVFVYKPEDGVIDKYAVSDELVVTLEDQMSFAAHGIMGFDAELIWVSEDVSFVLDEASGQIARWNPREMTIDSVVPVEPSILEREDLKVQFQQGIAAGDRLFTALNWRDWETHESVPGVALGIFDAEQPAEPPLVLEDERCASSVAINPFVDEDGNVYIIGDGGLGFDRLASPKKTELPQCVLRVLAGTDEYDPDFFVDLQEATGSPAFYTAHPMPGRKLLVNQWSSEVDPNEVADPKDPSWYWDYPPYFEYSIVDLEDGSSKPVTDLPRAAVQFSVTLRVDGENYVQLYRQDGGSVLHRVDPDGTVTEVLSAGPATDIQYLGRL